MAKTEYDIVWKKGGWFEDGHFALVPKKTFEEKLGGALLGYIIIIAVLLFVLSIIALTLPLWIVIIGFQMVREKRYYAGIISLLAVGYFYFDIKKQWITGFLSFGYTNDKGEFSEGLFDPKYLEYFEMINLIAVGLGLAYIMDAILISKYGKKFNDNRITKPQFIIYFGGMILGFLLSSSMKIDGQVIKDISVKESVGASPIYENSEFNSAMVDTASVVVADSSIYEHEDMIDSAATTNTHYEGNYETRSPSDNVNSNNAQNNTPKLDEYGKTVPFIFGEAMLEEKNIKILNNIIQIMNYYKDSKFDIIGYSSKNECEGCAINLSEHRANLVRDYLLNEGIEGNRLFVKYFPPNNSSEKENKVLINLRRE